MQPTGKVRAVRAQTFGVHVSLETNDVTVEPGGVATATVRIRNTGMQVEEFRIEMMGPAGNFTTAVPGVVNVYPDTEQAAELRFSPPRAPTSWPGRIPFTVVARSARHQGLSDGAQGTVTVGSFTEMHAELRPESSRGRRPSTHHVVTTNAGNTPIDVHVALGDLDEVLSFDPAEASSVIQPGAEWDAPIRVAGDRMWFGRTKATTFTALVSPVENGAPITLTGRRNQVPVLPWWIPTAAAVVAALVIAVMSVLPKDTVPPTRGLTLTEATQRLADEGYKVLPIPRSDPEVPAGQAISTDPEAGDVLNPGETVRLFISTGPCRGECPVPVPDVEGLGLRKATAKLRAEGFKLARVIRVPNAEHAAGHVISSKPEARSLQPRGSAVVLKVSRGSPTSSTAPSTASGEKKPVPDFVQVPEVIGFDQSRAVAELERLGLQVGLEQRESSADAGTVVDSNPRGGSELEKGETVTLFVSTGTPPVYSQDPLAVDEGWGVDVDEGLITDPGQADFLFEAQSETARYLRPQNGAALAAVGVVEPTYQACANEDLYFDPIDVAGLEAGSVVCVRTDQGRLSVVTIDVPPGFTLEISYTTYK